MDSSAANENGDACVASLGEVAELFADQAPRVRRLVRAGVRAPDQLIEDACQLAWIRLLRCRARVRRATVTAWLVRTAIREAIKLVRHDDRELPLEALADDTRAGMAPATQALPEEIVEQRARLESIRVLPERQQRLVWLQGLGLDYAEMAGQTGATRRTVERQLLRAKRTLANQAA